MTYLKKVTLPIVLFIFSTMLTVLTGYFTTISNNQNSLLLFITLFFLSVALIKIFELISKQNNLLNLSEKINKSQWKLVFSCLALSILSNILLNVLLPTPTIPDNQNLIFMELEKSLPLTSLGLLSAPFFEEIIFRGFIYQNIFNKSLTGFFVSLLLFIGLHIASLDDLSLHSFLSYFIPTLFFTFVYKKTNRLECAIALHFLFNLFPLLLSYLVIFVDGSLAL